ncbi:tetratricopeptide repeat protein [Candidatus Fermentibacteria bacterium]|nr:tetratricopeptide repeat protein [Candidatus Fermentibacteria bacterium]
MAIGSLINMAVSAVVTSSKVCRILLYALILVTGLIYLPTLGFGFLGYDDPHQVYDNYIVTGGLSLETVKQSFTSFVIAHYQPLVTLSFAVEYALVGPSPLLYHLTNVLLHLLNVVLLYLLALRIVRNRAGALFVAAAFALHPMRMESIAWITERKDVLGGFFYLSSFLSYVRYREDRRGWLLAWSIVLFMCSLLCKAMAVTLAPVLLAYELILIEKGPRRLGKLALRMVPFVVLAAGVSLMAVIAHGWMGGYEQFSRMDFTGRLLLMSRNVLYYPLKLLMPTGLCAFHPLPEGPTGVLPLTYKLAPIPLLALLAMLLVFGRRNRLLLFGSIFYLVAIIPVSQVVLFGRVVVADRFTYLPSIGLLVMLWALALALVRRFGNLRLPLVGAAVVWLLLVGYASSARVRAWSSNVKLWSEVIRKYPDEPYPYTLRAFAYNEEGETGLALHDYHTAIALDPKDPKPYETAAFLLIGLEEYDQATDLLDDGLQRAPEDPRLFTAMGYVSLESGRPGEAMDWFEQSLAIDSTSELTLYGMAVIAAEGGDPSSAESMVTKALRYDRDFPRALNLLGNLLLDRGKADSALICMEKAARFERGRRRHVYLVDLGRARMAVDNVSGAIESFEQALELDEGSYVAHYNLGNALMRAGRLSDAVQSYDAAIALNPELPQPYLNRGNALLDLGLVGDALESYTSAIEADSSFAIAWANRARLLHHIGSHSEALRDIHTAIELGYYVDPGLLVEIEEAAGDDAGTDT